MTVLWQDITNQQNPVTLATQNVGVNTSYATFCIPPYSNQPGKKYIVQVTIIVPSEENQQASDYIEYSTSVSQLVVYIIGGSRTLVPSNITSLEAVAIDPDVVPA